MGMALELDGHDVRVAYDGPAALNIASVFKPTVVLLDIGLPVMDGYEIARRLRAMDNASAFRLIAVSGYGLEADRRRTMESGFDLHLVKPIDLAELSSLLRKWARPESRMKSEQPM
jgi:DNA-binding response OmpR family regulator